MLFQLYTYIKTYQLYTPSTCSLLYVIYTPKQAEKKKKKKTQNEGKAK